jgi:chromosome partitioning protein
MVKKIVFFNNKGGVGKTTMVYHTAYMMAELGKKVLVADLDPQANLTSMFLTQERLEEVFLDENSRLTITDVIQPVVEGEPYQEVHVESINSNLFGSNISLILGNLTLSIYEDNLSDAWTKCLNNDAYAFKVTTLFNKLLTDAAEKVSADYILVDVGPNLGAINRSVLIAADYIIIPVASDLFSLQGIKNLGKTLEIWHQQWQDRQSRNPKPQSIFLPGGKMKVAGYIAMQHTAKESRPVKAYLKWANRIPETYQKFVLHENPIGVSVEEDSNCLGFLRHYHSLMPMGMEARKPIFLLKPADGAIGAHYQAVLKVYQDFKQLTEKIISVCQ